MEETNRRVCSQFSSKYVLSRPPSFSVQLQERPELERGKQETAQKEVGTCLMTEFSLIPDTHPPSFSLATDVENQGFSVFLTLKPFNTVPYVVVTTNQKIISVATS